MFCQCPKALTYDQKRDRLALYQYRVTGPALRQLDHRASHLQYCTYCILYSTTVPALRQLLQTTGPHTYSTVHTVYCTVQQCLLSGSWVEASSGQTTGLHTYSTVHTVQCTVLLSIQPYKLYCKFFYTIGFPSVSLRLEIHTVQYFIISYFIIHFINNISSQKMKFVLLILCCY